MKKTVSLLVFVFGLTQMTAQTTAIWQKTDNKGKTGLQKIRPTAYSENETYYTFDAAALEAKLTGAASRFSGKSGVVISIPNSAGALEMFQVWENSNFEPALQAQFPQIRAYIGKGLQDKTATLYFSLSPAGIQTMVLRADQGSEFIEPYTKDASVYVLFDSKTRIKGSLPFVCNTEDYAAEQKLAPMAQNAARSSSHVYKTMRLALSCTGEYGAFHGGTTALALAAMNATMTRVNGVYDIDLAVHLNIIGNDAAVIYVNAATDPYSDAASMNNWNGELQANLTSVIGSAAYDIGHLFGATGGGGNAGCIGCVCSSGKGSGITSPSDGIPMGDTFDIDYVAHEMGHQLGGTHSFSFQIEGSGTNVEPGSGSTIMGYAGITGNTDVQAHSDDYFTYANIQQIQDNLATKSCPVSTQITNATPVVNAGADYNIPRGTAFVLTGSATDADGDALTYTWEQNDVATTQDGNASLASATKTGGPTFRSFAPSASPMRYMPSISKIKTNTLASSFESVSNVARELNFTLTARDNSAFGGQTATDNMKVNVIAGTGIGPFAVTSPNTSTSINAGNNFEVTWNVAGTNGNGINAANVDIYLSIDGGNTYPILLASQVPNDGTETITLPNNLGSQNRIMVKANKNIFFDISNANFTVSPASATQAITFNGVEGTQNKVICSDNSVAFPFKYFALGGFTGTTTFSATGNPAGSTVSFSSPSANANADITMTIGNLTASPAGSYTITVTSTSGSITKSVNYYLQLGFSPVVLASPANQATAQENALALSWNVNSAATAYDVQVATDSAFTNIVASGTVSGTSFDVANLNGITDYFWRVKPKNDNCSGTFTAPFKFTTANCGSIASPNVPVAISATAASTINSTLTISAQDSQIIDDLNVSVNISHTWINDLIATLITPSGAQIQLFSHQCDPNTGIPNVAATFDDSGIALVCGADPGISGKLIPAQPLSVLIGQASAGTWTLRIRDSYAGDGGSLNSWSLNICGAKVLGVVEHELATLAVYPNPNHGNFNVRMDKVVSDKVQMAVYDIQGRRIFEKEYNAAGSFNENIQLNNVQAGVYLLSFADGGKKEVKRIVVQ